MRLAESKKYEILNEIAEKEGIIIFGGSEDCEIPLGELRQAFAIDEKMYNRSIEGLSVKDARAEYTECVEALAPEAVLLHIGAADLVAFEENPLEFDNKYRELIEHIKSRNPKCRIAVVSLRNYDNDPVISNMNTHLKYIAESENCEYGDIANRRVWNPKNTKDAVEFVYSIGFVRSLKNKRSMYDLVKILFLECFSVSGTGRR